ncbi:LON peptidase substrate-binding domain-containing protein [Pseudomonas aeruginosa]|uniref:LON peptidase substrate-binding domain-containing protein n=1 Tax=Pseudomonas aeruginosa TaxID=287 RepID=UPI0003B97EBF|nr:LON peptidase substrate-binding domain-containing protein [Pseudomonas aeruginosa]EIU3400802.1 LON peptidase substrate-binding domain-containing protein [Pseudomonas aeruginosa]EIZ0543884.1 LON peptidase substrate-binding domain-containing protein [Pseudomonas aeruginosa]EKV4130984.1 LON peptidase substrate-binding domain-containing protein [Pseudomonas aeruginosa]EKW0411743.1 LON peptidase substrate-binding domain-containing protein [Pseudomonas aeruginosa]EKW1421567.1 LON peptidase substr
MKLPLFPLNAVLFPGCRLDLQIFEARYLDMISRCMKQGTGFGVVTIGEGREVGEAPSRLAMVGCEASVRDWQQRPNGLLGIRVEGGRRFQVLSVEVQADQLSVGEIEWFEDLPEQPLTYEHNDLAALLSVLAEHPMVAALEMGGEPGGQQDLANQLAYLLPFDTERKLELLALPDAQMQLARIQVLLGHLQGELGID